MLVVLSMAFPATYQDRTWFADVAWWVAAFLAGGLLLPALARQIPRVKALSILQSEDERRAGLKDLLGVELQRANGFSKNDTLAGVQAWSRDVQRMVTAALGEAEAVSLTQQGALTLYSGSGEALNHARVVSHNLSLLIGSVDSLHVRKSFNPERWR